MNCRNTASCLLGSCFLCVVISLVLTTAEAQTIRVDVTPEHVANSFRPTEALGAGVDRIPLKATDKVFTEPVLKQILSAGWQTVTYRQNTELYVEAWHWNPKGTWSEPGNKGYFVGDSTPTEFIRHSFGYPLPHAGFSHPDGTSYSRLTDGDVNTYWKSNPYLTKAYTGEEDTLHPQWVVVDMEGVQEINAIRINWADPYAKRYLVQYWTGTDPIEEAAKGSWVTFPGGEVNTGKGGNATLQLSQTPVPVRFVRIWMTESSGTCDTHGSADRRNCLGYGIRELFLGTTTPDGRLHDVLRHTADRGQTTTICSSVDPWYEVSLVNDRGDQVGFDLFFTSGITRGLPTMIPVAMLYDTPENAAAQIAYVEKRGYPISYVEMGEEPDGKHALPEDYGALYLQWATALHKIDPKLKLGGPIFEGVNEDIHVWPDAQGRTSWMGRFVDYLKSHGRLADLSFVSFEHYPFEPCTISWSDLYTEPQLMKHILQVWRKDGVPQDVPLMVTENHLAASLTGPMTTIFAALWLADNVGSFFDGGFSAFYHSPIQPQGVQETCLGWASWSNFVSDENYNIKGYTSPYFAAHMINLEWVQHHAGIHHMFPSSTDIKDPEGNVLVTSYTVLRPDGNWSLMLVNRDETTPHMVRVVFEDSKNKREASFSGPVNVVTFGSEQYVWINDGPNSHPDPDHAPVATTVSANSQTTFTLPKASVTVLRGRV